MSLTAAHRARLVSAGVDPDVLSGLSLSVLVDGLPPWWASSGNALYAAGGVDVPAHVIANLTYYPVSDVLVVFGSALPNLSSFLIGGSGALAFFGPSCELTAGDVYCGADSSIVLNGAVVATREAVLDARNGGSIVAASGQLWAARVYLATDDMHALVDASSGARLNTYGGRIVLGSHVWLGREVIVTGDVEIGDGAVVGLRSLVRGQKVPARTAVAGTPARVIRENVTWREDDLP